MGEGGNQDLSSQDGKVEDGCSNKFVPTVEPRYASQRFQLEHDLIVPTGTWKRAGYLLITATTMPTFLGLPSAIAALGWGAGIPLLVVSCAALAYCNCLFAALHEYGGRRLSTTRQIAKAIMGPKHRSLYIILCACQYGVIGGTSVSTVILGAQILEAIYSMYCGTDCSAMGTTKWTMVAGCALILVAQLPDMAHIEKLTIVTSCVSLTYTTITVTLAGLQRSGDVSYSITGTSAAVAFNALNGIGVIVFICTNNIIPEIQSTLAPDAASGGSCRPMRKAIVMSYTLLTSLFLIVSVVGYWAYGNTVGGFLLGMLNHPRWLVTFANAIALCQLMVSEQIFEYVVYEAVEVKIVARFGRSAPWLCKQRTNADGRTVLVPTRAAMLVTRIPYVVIVSFIAATFPFFTQVMGFVGAVGLTPNCFTFPIVMYLMVYGSTLTRWQYHANVVLAIITGAAGTAAAIGALRSIIVAVQNHHMYS